jgi:hypothetical protein
MNTTCDENIFEANGYYVSYEYQDSDIIPSLDDREYILDKIVEGETEGFFCTVDDDGCEHQGFWKKIKKVSKIA